MIRLSLQLRIIKKVHDDVILTSAMRSYICLKLNVADCPSNKYTYDCKNVTFCIKKKKDNNFTNIIWLRGQKYIVIGVYFTLFTRFNQSKDNIWQYI